MVAEHNTRVKRVNKDDLRAMLDGGTFHRRNESTVLAMRDAMISVALQSKVSAIVDDTNLHPKHVARLGELAELHDAELVTVDFTDVPLRVCIARDAARQNPVGAKVIRGMARQFLPRPARRTQDASLTPAIIVDLDGTLAELGDRNVFDAARCELDTLNPAVSSVVAALRAANPELQVIACTGRSEKHRDVTVAWLDTHCAVDLLLMRPDGDQRPDFVVKRELFIEHVEPQFCVSIVFEDRDGVVAMWRDLGLDCFQVAEER